MKQQVIRRIKVWKRFYALKTTGVDENSDWKDILLKLNLSLTESIMLGKSAISECQPFDFEEHQFLAQLPYYKEVKELIAPMYNDSYGNYFLSSLPNGDNIYFIRYPSLSEVSLADNLYHVPIVVATIVRRKPVDFDEDIYVWCGINRFYDNVCKHLIIRYADTKPDDFILPNTL